MCVVDASVVIKWFIAEPYKDEADKILDEFASDALELIAPDIVIVEVGNAFWKRATKSHDISTVEAADHFRDFLSLKIDIRPSLGLASAALKLAISEQRPIYDMLYIALAEQSACEFVTADEKLFNALSKKFSCLRWIGDL